MTAPIVVYHGPSMIDGSPIVCLATTGSSNVKTGAMIQTWIVRQDLSPIEASQRKLDGAICGECPRRHSLGGDCYVTVFQAPHAAWKLWGRSGRPGENWSDERAILRLQTDARSSGLRLGSYGDPAAVPHGVWSDLIDALQPRSTVGYTHRWRALVAERDRAAVERYPQDCRQGYSAVRERWFRDHVMASCDSRQEALDARDLGWRYFLAVGPSVPASAIPERTVQCPATVSDRTCATCGACDGASRGSSKASVYLLEHGPRSSAKARRIAGLRVLR